MEWLIKEELKTTVGDAFYNGWHNRTTFGYHSYNIDNINIEGQRNPKMRLNRMRKYISFKNKKVLDLGCNVGAMLHHLFEIKEGLGYDFDYNCINAGNNISKILGRKNINLFKHDFDSSQLSFKEFKPDIIFILSLGSWIKSWEELYQSCLDTGAIIILETNNDKEGKEQLEFFKDYKLIISESKDDTTGNKGRKTYLI